MTAIKCKYFSLYCRTFINKESANLNSYSTINTGINHIVSSEDFQWVKRILPPSRIPKPPLHSSYPTPSGWAPPAENIPDLPYFVVRTRYHDFPVLEEQKKNGQNLTHIKNIEGDIWALERSLVEVVRPFLDYDPATRVHEMAQMITVKGCFKDVIIKFLQENGF